jgi:hypothetical protein
MAFGTPDPNAKKLQQTVAETDLPKSKGGHAPGTLPLIVEIGMIASPYDAWQPAPWGWLKNRVRDG